MSLGARASPLCVLLLVLVAVAPRALAATDGQDAYFDIFVNEQRLPVTHVVMRDDDLLVPAQSLRDAGLLDFSGTRETIEGEEFVSLRSLSPKIHYALDVDALSVKVTAAASMFEATRVDLNSLTRPPDYEIRSNPSLFANYSLEMATQGGPGIFTELGGSIGNLLLTSGWSKAPGQHAVRGLTTLQYDQPEVLRRWEFGEASATTGLLGGSTLLAGVGMHTEFSLDPYAIHRPLPQLSGTASTPSRLDVYVNGRLVREQTVAPGNFSLQNLPASSGAGNVQYVLQDAFGRTQTLTSQYYLASELLNPGENDFAYQVGFPRQNLGRESFSFSPHPAVLLHHRMGITSDLTLGGRFEGGWHVASGGPTVALGLPLGQLQASASLSSGDYQLGGAGALAYGLLTNRFTFGSSLQLQTAHYANLSVAAPDDRPTLTFDVFGGTSVMRDVSVFVSYAHETWRDLGARDTFELRSDYTIYKGITLVGSVQHASDPIHGNGVSGFLSVLVSFDKDALADLTATRSPGQTTFEGAVQKPLPQYSGYGYRLLANNAGVSAAAQYAPTFARFEADYDHVGSSNSAEVFASGGLVWIDHSLAATQPIQNGYALIEVPGVPGVRGTLNNQTVGTTDSRGDLLVPNLSPYVANRIAIVSNDVPLNFTLPRNEFQVGTPYRAGTVVRFDAHRFTALSGTVAMLERAVEIAPSYGTLDVDVNGTTKSSPLGKDGAFYLENVPTGRYVGHVQSDYGSCLVSIEVPPPPPGEDSVIDLGKLTCPKIATPTQASGGTP